MRVTSELLWRAAVIAALVDIPLLVLAGRVVPPPRFRTLQWPLATAAFILYALLWGVFGSSLYWDEVYRALFPGWARWLLPAWFGSLYAAFALVAWRVARRARRWPAVWFIVMGGLVSVPGHAIGMARGLMEVPMLSRASAAAALVFGVFEFVFYWSLITLAAAAAAWSSRLHTGSPEPPGPSR